MLQQSKYTISFVPAKATTRMVGSFKIERGIQIPERNIRKRTATYMFPIREMNVGESFIALPHDIENFIKAYTRLGYEVNRARIAMKAKFTVRTTPEGVRVFRTA